MADKEDTSVHYSRDIMGQPVKVTGTEAAIKAQEGGNKPIGALEAVKANDALRNLSYVDENWGTAGKLGMGAISGLTLGMGPGYLASQGLVDPGHLRAAQASGLYTAGDVAGTLAPALASGGESLLLRATPAGLMTSAGSLAERLAGGVLGEAPGLLGRLSSAPIRMAARGAVEGGLINMGHTIGDNLVQNKPLAAEALLASGVDGALFGGLLGGSLGTAGALVEHGLEASGKLLSNVAGKGVKAEANVARALGETSEAYGGASGLKAQVKLLEDSGSSIEDSTAGKHKAVKSSIDTYTAVRNDAIEELSKTAPHEAPHIGRIQERLDKIVEARLGSPELPAVTAEIASAKSMLDAVVPPQKVAGSKVAAETAMPKSSWEYQESFKPIHERMPYDAYKAGLKPSYEIPGMTVPSGERPTWKQLASARDTMAESLKGPLRQEILNALDSEIRFGMEAAGKSGAGLEGIADKYGAATSQLSLAKSMEANLGKKLSNQLQSSGSLITPTDLGTAAGMSLINPFVATGWLGTKVLGRMVQKNAEPWLAKMAYKNMLGVDAASATMTAQSKIRSSLKNFFKKSTQAPTQAAKVSNAERYKSSAAKTSEANTRKGYELASARTEQLLSDAHNERIQRQANQLVAEGHTEMAAALLGVNHRAVQYLMWNTPPSKAASQLNSLRAKPMPKGLTMEEFKFNRIKKGVTGPLSLLDDLESGNLSRDSVKAMRYVYPELHSEVVAAATEQIYEAKVSGNYLPMDKIASLGILLDAPIDTSLQPEYITEVQMALAAPQPGEEVPPQPAPQPMMAAVQDSGYLTPLQTQMV